jgi:heme/copper-type cytochrome/quinol oxidase subunit 2
LPEPAHSPNAEDLTALYWVLAVFATVLVVAINAALIGLALRFRAKRGHEPRRLESRRPAQFVVGGAFAAIALVVFVLGVMGTENASEVEASGDDGLQAAMQRTAQKDISLPDTGEEGEPADPLVVEATGQQWIWRYEYPDGTFSYYDLVVPVDTAVVVKLSSTDVAHRWWVQGLGGKFDAMPGQSNQTWFKADEEGEFEGASYQFSGASYAAMRTQVSVVSVEEYQAWLEQQSTDIQEAQEAVQAAIEARGAEDGEAEAEVDAGATADPEAGE